LNTLILYRFIIFLSVCVDLYQSDTQPLDTNGGTKSEGNSKYVLNITFFLLSMVIHQ